MKFFALLICIIIGILIFMIIQTDTRRSGMVSGFVANVEYSKETWTASAYTMVTFQNGKIIRLPNLPKGLIVTKGKFNTIIFNKKEITKIRVRNDPNR